jgi:hypothetical protein
MKMSMAHKGERVPRLAILAGRPVRAPSAFYEVSDGQLRLRRIRRGYGRQIAVNDPSENAVDIVLAGPVTRVTADPGEPVRLGLEASQPDWCSTVGGIGDFQAQHHSQRPIGAVSADLHPGPPRSSNSWPEPLAHRRPAFRLCVATPNSPKRRCLSLSNALPPSARYFPRLLLPCSPVFASAAPPCLAICQYRAFGRLVHPGYFVARHLGLQHTKPLTRLRLHSGHFCCLECIVPRCTLSIPAAHLSPPAPRRVHAPNPTAAPLILYLQPTLPSRGMLCAGTSTERPA